MLGKPKTENWNTKETGLGTVQHPLHVQPWLPFPYLPKQEWETDRISLWDLRFQGDSKSLKGSRAYVPLDGLLCVCVWLWVIWSLPSRQHSCVLSQPAARDMKCILVEQASWKLLPAFLQTSSHTRSFSRFRPWFFCCSESQSYECNSCRGAWVARNHWKWASGGPKTGSQSQTDSADLQHKKNGARDEPKASCILIASPSPGVTLFLKEITEKQYPHKW